MPRQIPAQPKFLHPVITALCFGFIQYLVVCVEFLAIMQSVWRAKMYSLFWFLLVDVLLLIVVIGLLSIIQTYLQLQYENFAWWWRSFFTGASGGIYLALYSIFYMFEEFDVSNIDSDMIYLIYMVIIVGGYSLMAGMISVSSSYIFVEYLYTGIRGD